MRNGQRLTAPGQLPPQRTRRGASVQPAIPDNIRELQRTFGNAAMAGLIQRAWATQGYQADNSDRTLHVEARRVVWGATQNANQFANHVDDTRPRSILFETIATEAGWARIAPRMLNAPVWDTGLTLVLNQAYTPAKIYDMNNVATRRNATQGYDLRAAKAALDNRFNQVAGNWNGPPVQMVTAAWERRERAKADGDALEIVQSSVPYTTLRVIAGSNAGATEIENALRVNHREFWRKMGDDDMPIPNPNQAGPEVNKLQEVEEAGWHEIQPTLVTFGYNLTTTGTQPPITGILENMYRTEMALRDRIAELGAPMYPSEPTTFYRPREGGSVNQAWQLAEGQHTGGSGQQLEGAKLARALKADMGYKHFVFHTVMVETSAGARNDAIVNLLNGWWQGGTGSPFAVSEDLLEAEINKLDRAH